MSIRARIEKLEENIGHINKIPREDSIQLITLKPDTPEEEKKMLVGEAEKKLQEKYGLDADLSDVVFLISYVPRPIRPAASL